MIARLAAAAALMLAGAAAAAPRYDPIAAFAPFAMPTPANRVRGADGLPGPDYWQNRADYELRATLDPARRSIAGTATIRYTNNGPQPLDPLWLQLDQNRYRPGSRGARAAGGVPAGTTAESWIRQAAPTVLMPAGAIRSVMVDPDHHLPDRDRSNDSLTGPGSR